LLILFYKIRFESLIRAKPFEAGAAKKLRKNGEPLYWETQQKLATKKFKVRLTGISGSDYSKTKFC